ncbi:unnamed protein product [Ceutorhynchus assimilis]|uniref:Uncharacterized protein n=1 Tax=Ceutorhynchus assimilis TaxID=467358 RepID=A0A9N9MXR1_9CUCU|nr:unnamed protein product [Ceutorhynchus assimilis]
MYYLKDLTIFACLLILHIEKTFADYCEFGTCDENTEYCCGDNTCCKKTIEVWYYWALVLLIVIVITIAACFYLKKFKSKYKYSNYSILPQQVEEVTATPT